MSVNLVLNKNMELDFFQGGMKHTSPIDLTMELLNPLTTAVLMCTLCPALFLLILILADSCVFLCLPV